MPSPHNEIMIVKHATSAWLSFIGFCIVNSVSWTGVRAQEHFCILAIKQHIPWQTNNCMNCIGMGYEWGELYAILSFELHVISRAFCIKQCRSSSDIERRVGMNRRWTGWWNIECWNVLWCRTIEININYIEFRSQREWSLRIDSRELVLGQVDLVMDHVDLFFVVNRSNNEMKWFSVE